MSENNSTIEHPAKPESEMNYFKKLWNYRKYLTVELFYVFYILSFMLNLIAIQNFPLEKACRVNYGYNRIVCDKMLDKDDIECENYNFDNIKPGATPDLLNLTISSLGFNYTVCRAQSESQKLLASVNGIRGPSAAIFTLIVLLFAGGWADRYNKRKPCMILPIVGEMLSSICLFTSSIFFNALPMEFGAYLEAIVPEIFGGQTLCVMAIYSHMTITTPEEDRIFRFGIFMMVGSAVPFMFQPISGVLFKILGYTASFGLELIFHIIAILCIIFFIDEVKLDESKNADKIEKPITDAPQSPPTLTPIPINGVENLAYEMTSLDEIHLNTNASFKVTSEKQEHQIHEPPTLKTSLCCEIFDPTLAIECWRLPFIKRENNGRLLLIVLTVTYFLCMGPAIGEADYIYNYTMRKLNWNGIIFSIYNTVTSLLVILGTSVGTAILSKILKLSDAAIGTLSALLTVVSHLFLAFAENTLTFFIGSAFDTLGILSVIAIRSIGPSIVATEESSKFYSVLGISDCIARFIFTPLFSTVYAATVDTFPGAIFLFAEIFYIPCVLTFILCYFLLRRFENGAKKNAIENGQNGNNAVGHVNSDAQNTSL